MRFSERYGYKAARQSIQIESVSPELRNTLWSLLQIHIWNDATGSQYVHLQSPQFQGLCSRLWLNYFKSPLDTMDRQWFSVLVFLRKYFFGCEWYEVYDFVEFVATNYPPQKEKFIMSCNNILEREVSAYRFVHGLISPITDAVEIDEIDLALEESSDSVRTHLRRALELLSDRSTPDYRNSIKESISAVESLVAITVGERGTLGQLIKKLKNEIGLHSALATAFGNLYGYTSDEDGIRHAILESQNIGSEEATFFLVVCSAFVNFVNSKVDLKSGG
ncbi:MAG TPA: hypothetical protein VI386_21025 [Candidatus Sulfotelmatobacter sp.]